VFANKLIMCLRTAQRYYLSIHVVLSSLLSFLDFCFRWNCESFELLLRFTFNFFSRVQHAPQHSHLFRNCKFRWFKINFWSRTCYLL